MIGQLKFKGYKQLTYLGLAFQSLLETATWMVWTVTATTA